MDVGADSSPGGPQPCAVCKHLRRRCGEGCALAPYFPADKYEDFQSALSTFGLSNIQKKMNSGDQYQKLATAEAILFEGRCWAADPVNGSLGRVRFLQEQLDLWRSSCKLLADTVQNLFPAGLGNYVGGEFGLNYPIQTADLNQLQGFSTPGEPSAGPSQVRNNEPPPVIYISDDEHSEEEKETQGNNGKAPAVN